MESKPLKIVTIGGGSSYTPELIDGYIQRKDQLNIKEIWLVDIPDGEEKLEIVGAMAKRQIKAANLDWEVHLTLDRYHALKNADFVTTQFRVGLLDARIKDERIPLSHGALGQETNGAGGIFKAFRTIHVIGEIIKDMEEQCPDAWLINFSNPAGMVTEAAINKFGWKKTIGLCNAPVNHQNTVADALGVSLDQLFFKFAGINHYHWHKVYNCAGEDITSHVIKLLYANQESEETDLVNIHATEFNIEQLLDMDLLPCGYHRYYYNSDDMLELAIKDFENGETRAQVVKATEKRLFELYKDPDLDYKPEELMQRGGAYYSDAACEIITSIVNDQRKVMVVSTANKGAIEELPYDAVVEVTSVMTSHGPENYNIGKLPISARGELQLMKAMEQTVVEAAITGNYNTALRAFTMNPLIPGGKLAKEILNELFIAHEKFLPQFSKVIHQIKADHPDTVTRVNKLMESN